MSSTSNGDHEGDEKSQDGIAQVSQKIETNENRNDMKPPENEKKDESESDDEDNEVGLLDRPVEVTGSRERKKVQRLELSFNTPSKEKPEIPEGSGQKLGDCPRIEHQIQKNSVDDLKPLHKILFARVGIGKQIKNNIRKFSGFTFKKESSEFNKKKGFLDKIRIANLKHICEVLDVERSGAKEEIVSRILDFLLDPKASGKSVPQPKKSGKRKRSKEKAVEKNKTKKAKRTESPTDSGDHSEETSDEVASDMEITKNSKHAKVNSKKIQGTKKDTEKNSKRKNKKAVSSGDSSSDDEPLVKIAKSPPSNEDIKAFVKKILKTADLEEITMKKVIKQVFDQFPDFDLNARKDFIKATVKSVIS